MKNPVIFFLLFSFSSFAQMTKTRYWIRFTDRNNSPYSIQTPHNYISQRAIDRRTKQNIRIKENDLPVNPSYIDSVISKGAVLLNEVKWFNAITIFTSDTNTLLAIKALPFVKNTEPVKRWKFNKEPLEAIEHPTGSGRTGNISSFDYGPAFNQVNMIGADCMHDLGFAGEGMVIAVLDAGFYNADVSAAFDSLRANNQILGTWDFVANESSVYEDDAHGEMVLSCMGANIPGQIVGTAPKASYWLLRTEDAPSEYIIEEDNWVAGAEFADSVGADIINSSLGYTTFDDPSQDHTYADMDGNTTRCTIGADIAASKGILVVNSAGNSGNSSWYYIGAPADGDSVLAIGAVDANENYASFSSKGPSSDGDVKPNVSAQGQGTIVYHPDWGVITSSGTSFSSPLIAGAAAVLWQSQPNATNMQIFNAIQKSASQATNPDDFLGYGIPDMCGANLILGGVEPERVRKEDDLWQFGPNPFNTFFKFNFISRTAQNILIEMYDLSGRKLFSEERQVNSKALEIIKYTNEFDHLSNGLYIFSVTTRNNKYIKKVCKY